MNKYCIGCGSELQNNDRNLEGYTPKKELDETTLCERCFRIQHYHDYQMIPKTNDDFYPILEKISASKDLVLLVVDLFSLPPSLPMVNQFSNNPVILVLTKRDILPKSVKDEKLLSYFNSYPFVDKIMISSKKNGQMDELMAKIEKYKKSKNVYVVGFTNAGKSTMINRMIANYGKTARITTSPLPSTTLSTIEIPLAEDLILVDTPGILMEGSVFSIADPELLEKVASPKEIAPLTYQIRKTEYFKVEDLFCLQIEPPNYITFYFSPMLSITRLRFLEEEGWTKKTITVPSDSDLAVLGMGFIRVGNKTNLTVYQNHDIKIYARPMLIGDKFDQRK